jgi:hypothetical protein
MGRETKIAFDEALPGELVVIVLFALFLVLVISLLFGLTYGDTREAAKAHEFNCGRKSVVEHNSHSQRKLGGPVLGGRNEY